MEYVKGVRSSSSINESSEEEMELRRGPWTVEEDFTLMNHIALHGEGRWNSLARTAGLKRTGKSCRLRWLNYLRPDVRRGNITPEEQLLILELHCRWGNRWSKIAQYLPGRTDNEIKNYWRTRVQKHAKQLKCDVNSKQFKDTMRYLWMPRLVERIQAAKAAAAATEAATSAATTTMMNSTTTTYHLDNLDDSKTDNMAQCYKMASSNYGCSIQINSSSSYTSENSSSTASASSDSFGPPVSDLTDCYNCPVNNQGNNIVIVNQDFNQPSLVRSPTGYLSQQLQGPEFEAMEHENNQWFNSPDNICDNFWNVEDMWFLHQHLNTNL